MTASADWPLISAYTRAQALQDGVLVNISAVAREAGIRFPVAATRAVWIRCVEVPEGVIVQDEGGRAWDLVWMLRSAMQRAAGREVVSYVVYVRNDNRGPRPVSLRAVCGPGDDGEPVITVMLPGED